MQTGPQRPVDVPATSGDGRPMDGRRMDTRAVGRGLVVKLLPAHYRFIRGRRKQQIGMALQCFEVGQQHTGARLDVNATTRTLP